MVSIREKQLPISQLGLHLYFYFLRTPKSMACKQVFIEFYYILKASKDFCLIEVATNLEAL